MLPFLMSIKPHVLSGARPELWWGSLQENMNIDDEAELDVIVEV